MNVTPFLLVGVLLVTPLVGLAAAPAGKTEVKASGRDAAAKKGEVHGIYLKDLDRSVKPCQNFYQFADGGWMAANPIPAAYPRWGTFTQLYKENQERLHKILEGAAADTKAPAGSELKKLGDFYASGMDVKAIDAQGLKPLTPELARISAVKDLKGLQAEVAHLQGIGVNVLFRFSSTQDAKNSTQVIGEADQGGLGLPDRDYYLKDDAKSKKTRAAYAEHVVKMFELMGDAPAEAQAGAKTVMGIETSLAKASMSRVERRNPKAVYNKMDVKQLEALTPDFNWPDYFASVNHAEIRSINVASPDFFKALGTELKTVPMKDWRTYLRWHLIASTAPYLSKPFVQESFHFHGEVMTGTKAILPRWQRVVSAEDRALGFALGKLYVKKYFPPEAKAKALTILHNIKAALHDDLETLSWMSPATRKAALKKLGMIVEKIGYPDKWRDYSALAVNRGPYVLNVLRARTFDFNRRLNKIGKPLDRTEWDMTPQTVNAYYDPQMNEIVFPAGILQPPFFDPKADDAVNYGAMGMVMGHEITHGFDDQGSQYDGYGNLNNWWTAEDAKNFKARGECIADQFSQYVVDGDVHLNGKLVEGESIADLGGLTLSYNALEKSLEGKPRPPKIDGFTPEQRFFLAYARIWATNVRPQFSRLMATVDPHPPARYRVNGPLSNMPAFAKAWGCKPGDPMVRPDHCRIW